MRHPTLGTGFPSLGCIQHQLVPFFLKVISGMVDVPSIALRAYQLWDAAGRPERRSDDFYFAAEQELRLLIEKQIALDQGSSHDEGRVEANALAAVSVPSITVTN
jgi:hypothetical protein